jgi:hypothetical protein
VPEKEGRLCSIPYRIEWEYDGRVFYSPIYDASSFGEIYEQAKYIYLKQDKCRVYILIFNEHDYHVHNILTTIIEIPL